MLTTSANREAVGVVTWLGAEDFVSVQRLSYKRGHWLKKTQEKLFKRLQTWATRPRWSLKLCELSCCLEFTSVTKKSVSKHLSMLSANASSHKVKASIIANGYPRRQLGTQCVEICWFASFSTRAGFFWSFNFFGNCVFKMLLSFHHLE